MRLFVFNTWLGVGAAVAALALLSALLPAGVAVKGLGLALALFALAVSVLLQVRSGRRSTRQVLEDVDHEAPLAARSFSGTIDLGSRSPRPRAVR